MNKKTHFRKKQSNKRANKAAKKQLLKMFVPFLFYLRTIFDGIVDYIFGYFCDGKKRVVPPTNNVILLESATTLAEKIRTKNRTSEKTVRAYIDRAKEVNTIVNAIVDECFEEAIQNAKHIDQDIASGKITNSDFEEKPFLGVPFTSKDSTKCKGMLQTLGLVSRKNTRATEDADVVNNLKNAGGILIATTNVPEVNMWQETRNMLFGQTKNPYNTTRTTGGSSGGEGALLAAGASAMGIGTDIGGSLRMPSFFCGIWSHKPTSDIVPTRGLTHRTGLEENSIVVAGPMCRYAQDLTPLLKILAGPNSNRLSLNKSTKIEDINFFYTLDPKSPIISSVSLELQESMQRVVEHLSRKLKGADNAPKEVQFPDIKHCVRLWRNAMAKEDSDFANELNNRQGRVNVWIELVKKVVGMSNFTLAALINVLNNLLIPAKSQWAEDTTIKLKREILTTLGNNGVLLYPSCPTTAPYHYLPFLRPFNFGYWGIFNVLRLPVTQVPLGLSKDGLPLGLQVVTAPYNDHLSIAVAKELEDEFGGWVPFLDDTKS